METINGLTEKSNGTLARIEEILERRKRLAFNNGKPFLIEHGEYSGDNWLIASMFFGYSNQTDKNYNVHITTDGVRCSESTGDAKTDAEFFAHANVDIADLLNLVADMYKALDAARKGGA